MSYSYTVTKTGSCFFYKEGASGKKKRVPKSEVPRDIINKCSVRAVPNVVAYKTSSTKKSNPLPKRSTSLPKRSTSLPKRSTSKKRPAKKRSTSKKRPAKKRGGARKKKVVKKKVKVTRAKKTTAEKAAARKRSMAALDKARYEKWVMYKKPGLTDDEIVEASDFFGTTEVVAEKLIRKYQRRELGDDAARYRKWLKIGKTTSPHVYSEKMRVGLTAADRQIRKFKKYER